MAEAAGSLVHDEIAKLEIATSSRRRSTSKRGRDSGERYVRKDSEKIKRAQRRKAGLERPWPGPTLPRRFHNTPEGRRQVAAYNHHVEAAAAANPNAQTTTTSPLESLVPIIVRHIPLAELKEAITPKYSGDIRYKPKIEEGVTASSTTIRQPERDPGPSNAEAPDNDLIELSPEEELEPLPPPNYIEYIKVKYGTKINGGRGHPLNLPHHDPTPYIPPDTRNKFCPKSILDNPHRDPTPVIKPITINEIEGKKEKKKKEEIKKQGEEIEQEEEDIIILEVDPDDLIDLYHEL
ncbi:hypothetical protein OUZ56_011549 [Daphnia magna]|uniref:Uncharacterized protein n=1 Tax=Daphnia magna TaxID=35525 RepID=A0ABQ9Z0N0_9CRUS|nr:hypothetical protein OUZ56_011549 [Daphnia magna]